MLTKKHPAKLLLFGEYTVIDNSLALALPYHQLYGNWAYPDNSVQSIIKMAESNDSLKSIADFFNYKSDKHPFKNINLELLKENINKGLWFNSNIPIGYGMGSSGALCAAIYDSYYTDKPKDNSEHLEILSKLESYFHGTSSGIDPLVSFLNSPLLINETKNIEILKNLNPDVFEGKGAVFLIDTGFPRKTEKLVNLYHDLRNKTSFIDDFITPIKGLVEKAISSYCNDRTELISIVSQISELQIKYMSAMIPTEYLTYWQEGINSSDYYLKLCGAGGGGYILGFTDDSNKLENINKKLKILKVSMI